MRFVRPDALWLLALALPLVLLHLRMRRRVRVVVPSLLVWDPSAVGGGPPRVAGIRPRDLLGLLLELLALGCLAVFAAGPVEGAAPAAERPVALVLDGSASTLAAGRFEEMRTLARRVLAASGPAAPASLFLAADGVRVLAAPGEGRARVEEALAAARPLVCGGGSLAAAAEAALGNGAEVFVLTDGSDPEAPALAARRDLHLVSVGRPEENRALVGIAFERERGLPAAAWLRVRGADGGVGEERVPWTGSSLEPGIPEPLVLPGGPADAFPLDDGVPLRLSGDLPPLRIAVLGPGGGLEPWLAAGLEAAAPHVDRGRSVLAGSDGLANLAERPDVLVVRGGAPPPPGLPALVLGAGEGPVVEAPGVRAGEVRHRVLRGVDPAEWIVTRGRTLTARAGDAGLLLGPSGPLALAGERGGVRVVLLGFDPGESTLPLSGSFPVFLRNALLWLGGGREEGAPPVVRAGSVLRLPVRDGRERLEVWGPLDPSEWFRITGASARPASPPERRFEVPVRGGAAAFTVPFPPDPATCLFLVPSGGAAFAAALLDPVESDLAPRVPRNADGFAPPRRPAAGGGPRSRAADFGLAAALLLLLEWLLFLGPASSAAPPRRDSFAGPGAAP